jgi:hypothetical protein
LFSNVADIALHNFAKERQITDKLEVEKVLHAKQCFVELATSMDFNGMGTYTNYMVEFTAKK